ncbi:hypothetical protein EV715DRAFT_268229, partial [Schizophyllum commune]
EAAGDGGWSPDVVIHFVVVSLVLVSDMKAAVDWEDIKSLSEREKAWYNKEAQDRVVVPVPVLVGEGTEEQEATRAYFNVNKAKVPGQKFWAQAERSTKCGATYIGSAP